MINPDLLQLLQCPEDRTPLTEAPAGLVQRLNQAITMGRVKNRGGQTVDRKLDTGLLRRDGKVLYPVFDGIPNMLADEAIPLEGLLLETDHG